MRLAAWDPAGNGWEEEGTPSIQQGALDAYKQQREAAAHSALRAPGQSVLKIGVRWSDHVFTPARHSLELVATLPGMYHLGVPHVREELLFSLVYLKQGCSCTGVAHDDEACPPAFSPGNILPEPLPPQPG